MKGFKPKALSEQVIVITGASSGIGLATAALAAKKGARIVMNARNDRELRNCAAEIRKLTGAKIVTASGDISKLEDIHKVRDIAVQSFSHIDTWVNNAGVSIYGDLLDENYEEERALFDINYWGTRMASAVAVKELCKNGGTLINVGSELSELAPPILGAYCATKHAAKAFTNSLRSEIELKKLPVNVTLVRPTAIATPMPEHGRNNLHGGEPALPSPLYHPEVVARAILRSAVSRQRDVYVGGQARLSAFANQVLPDLADWFIRWRSNEMKQGVRKEHKESDENLSSPPKFEGKIEGDYDQIILNRSLYSDLATLGVKDTIRLYLGMDDRLV